MKDFNSMIYDEIVSQKSWTLFDDESEGSLYCTAQYLRTGKVEQIVPKHAYNSAVKITNEDILALWDGSNAGEMLFGKEGFLASTMCKLSIESDEFIQDFIFHFLRFKTNDIKRATVGSAIPHVDPGMIENIEIPKLDLTIQKEVISIFESIKTNNSIVSEKISSSQTLLKSLINQVF